MWEKIKDANSSTTTERLKVPGGWIVRSARFQAHVTGGCSIHQIFINDPLHEWELD